MTPSILFILHLPPPVHGAAMVGKYIHDSELINSEFDCHYINLTTAKNLQDIGKGGIRKLWKFITLLIHIIYKVCKVKPQLVYVTPNACGGAFYKDFVVVSLLKAMRCKVVVHYHNKGVKTRQDRWLDDKLYRRFFRGLKVILLAEALYDDVKKYVRREDVFICPNGIPETLDHEPSVERHNAVPRLLFLSNLLESKGVLVLLDALKILKDKGYSFVCDFVGGETAEIDAARFAAEVETRGVNRIAVYQGKQYGEEKAECFAHSDVFVFPSLNEALPLVNMEAMEFRLPIVATNVGGVSEEITDGENGFVCRPNHPEELAACVEKLLDSKELREKMGEEGYRRFKEHFTLDVFEKELKACVKECCEMGGVILNWVYFYGRRYGAEKQEFFEKADIFVFPTLNETFGLVSLEAMEWKLPVISTDEGGIRDVVKDGENGLISEKQNPQSLSECLERLMNDKELRERMGEDGYWKFKEQFTLKAFENQFAKCIRKSLLGGVTLNLVNYLGRKYGTEKETFWQQADIFVFPTHYPNECFPLVLLEAMQHGVLCISTPEGGIKGIIQDGDNGLLVEQNNSQALASAIESLLNDSSLCLAIGQRGRKAYERQFTLTAFENHFVSLLRACV